MDSELPVDRNRALRKEACTAAEALGSDPVALSTGPARVLLHEPVGIRALNTATPAAESPRQAALLALAVADFVEN